MAIDLKPYEDEDVSIEIEDTTIKISGNIEYTDPSTSIEPFFNKIHEKVIGSSIKTIKLDLTDLNYINSAGITVFVKWIINLQQLPENQKYSMQFICNPKYKWQQQSIMMLARTAPKIVSIA